ncbi:MAG: ComEC/Rec2 family competence protein [Alphaproteobacteria bacterium]
MTAVRGLDFIAGELGAERERWAYWLAVAFGGGIAVYFGLKWEPPTGFGYPFPAIAVVPLSILFSFWFRRHATVAALGWILAVMAAGFSVAQSRALSVEAPVIERRIGPVMVTGRVLSAERKGLGRRVVLDRLDIASLGGEKTPHTIRVRFSSQMPPPTVGSRIRLRAMLMSPPESQAPGSFDFPRQAWFSRLGGVGYATSRWEEVLPLEAPDPGDRWKIGLSLFRDGITDRLLEGVGGEEATIAVALLTGETGMIPQELVEAYRNTGIAHLLSISGLHMSMVAGFVYFTLRALLALLPAVALRYPIKKWSATIALSVGFFYLLISGAAVPTQRAFLMAGLMFLGVLLDRRAISMRSVAWASVVVMVWQPQAVTGPSFQMSFAAVVALIAVYESVGGRLVRVPVQGWFAKPVNFLANHMAGLLLTTLVAGSATMPYAAYHFGRVTTYQMVTNLIVIPLTGVWVMPAGMVSLAVMPMGWERPVLTVMGAGIAFIDQVAREINTWPLATFVVPPIPTSALVAISLGGLWLCLWRRPWRMFGVVPIVVGAVVPFMLPRPDVLVSGDGSLMAVRAADGGLVLSPRGGSRMLRQTWELRYGDPGRGNSWPGWDEVGAGGRLRCDDVGCIYRQGGDTVALVRASDALEEDCRLATVVISAVPTRNLCHGPRLVIDKFDLHRGGTHVLWLKPGEEPRVETTAAAAGVRPWTPRAWKQ